MRDIKGVDLERKGSGEKQGDNREGKYIVLYEKRNLFTIKDTKRYNVDT